jgi:hypothetical protein
MIASNYACKEGKRLPIARDLNWSAGARRALYRFTLRAMYFEDPGLSFDGEGDQCRDPALS